ncbi:MAG: cytochrome P460 family protein [Chloroflexi bacterium]|nr:cytochrome P460 family protein [Chloroflexota bacterium]
MLLKRALRGARTIVPLVVVGLVACSTRQVEVTRLVPQETTRIVEQEVTKEVIVEQEVTRIVEQLVETIVTATPAEAPPAEAVDPTLDRVGFPADYQEQFTIFYEFDRPDNGTARVIWANDLAASVTLEELMAASFAPGEPFPYGSILVMEVYRAVRNEDNSIQLDENGRFVRGELSGIFAMRKEPGFGVKYGSLRSGEWEYAAYRPDGTVLTPPERTTSCAACHLEAGQGRDWVFGWHRAFGVEPPTPGENQIILVDYTFVPGTLTVTVGAEVSWVSQDVVFHTATAAQDVLFSATLRPQGRSNFTFEEVGTFDYFCAIHPAMRGVVVVTN